MTPVDNDFRIAVVGMACRFPDADTVGAYWRNLCAGHESIRPLPDATRPADPPAGYVHAGSTLRDYDRFDAEFFEMTAREAQLTDPQHRLFLLCAWEAFEDAGIVPSENPSPVGVFAGASLSTYLLRNLIGHARLFDSPSAQLHALHGNASDYLASKVSYKLDLTGPSVAVQSACSTSLVAVHQAVQALLDFECDVALAGGASVQVPQESGYIYEEGSILSPDGHCRVFDAEAAGTVFGSGTGAVVLKRLSDALADGNRIHAVIIGSAVNNDGARKVGYTAPGIAGQRAVIRDALSVAGIGADSIGYVEAHGTGTKLGDPIEVAALSDAYREHTQERGYCAIGSAKSAVGHLNAAAGVAGFIKAVLTVREGVLPPTLHFTRPNPEIDFAASPFFVNTELRSWTDAPRRAAVSAFGIGGTNAHVITDAPRRAAVSAFGIGGTNAHVIVEEPPAATATGPANGPRALLVSARTEADADRLTERLAAHLDETPDALADIAHTLSAGRRKFTHRRVVVARDTAEAAAALRAPLTGHAASAPALAWLFPGQGSAVGPVFTEIATAVPAFGDRLRHCAQLLRSHSGFDLDAALRDPAGTAHAQVALFTVEYALAEMWREFGAEPRELLGHSLGELVCATLAGVFELPDALRLVVARGRLMAAAPPGAMLAVSAGAQQLADRLPEDVWPAADNSATRSVVAGSAAAVRRLAETLAQDRIPTSVLLVEHAFHTPLMDEAAARFAHEVAAVTRHAPREPFWSNLTGAPITAAQATDPDYWARQMTSTVRFREAAEQLTRTHPALVGLEVGPGRSLVSFLRTADRAVSTVTTAATATAEGATDDSADAATRIVTAAGRLWLTGLEPNFAAIHGKGEPQLVNLPTYPFALQRYWVDPPESHVARATTLTATRSTAHAQVPTADAAALTVMAEAATQTAADDGQAAAAGGQAAADDGTPTSSKAAERTATATRGADVRPQAEPAIAAPATTLPGAESDPAADTGDEFLAAIRTQVAEVWCEALGVDRVGVDVNFFEAGGDSLLAVHIATRLRAVFPVRVVLSDLFARPTIAGVADAIAADLIDRLDELSDSEVALLLDDRETIEEHTENA